MMRCRAVALLVALALVLPAGQIRTIDKGGLGDGRYLVRLRVVPREQVPAECLADRALACVLQSGTVWVSAGAIDRPVRTIAAIAVYRADIPWAAYELAAHETCHAVAMVQDLVPDPCHNEDKGILPSSGRRGPRPG